MPRLRALLLLWLLPLAAAAVTAPTPGRGLNLSEEEAQALAARPVLQVLTDPDRAPYSAREGNVTDVVRTFHRSRF